MVLTRNTIVTLNMDAISELIDTKLSELKVSLLAEFTNKIDEYVNGKKEEIAFLSFQSKLTSLKTYLYCSISNFGATKVK